jgi:hypothetical protein
VPTKLRGSLYSKYGSFEKDNDAGCFFSAPTTLLPSSLSTSTFNHLTKVGRE